MQVTPVRDFFLLTPVLVVLTPSYTAVWRDGRLYPSFSTSHPASVFVPDKGKTVLRFKSTYKVVDA